jgi:imidazolonepropionase-like amidohydrolase
MVNDPKQNSFVLHGGTLIDGQGGAPLENAVLVVRDGVIEQVGQKAKVSIPDDVPVIEADGCTIMPGMFDCHVHVDSIYVDIQKNLFLHPTVKKFKTAEILKRTLHAGFTTIREAGLMGDVGFRQAINEGLIDGPRMIIAGAIGQTGGHFDEYYPIGFDVPVMGIPICNGVLEVQKAAREHLRNGVDFLKVCTTGGVVSPADGPEDLEWTLDELRVIVYEAKARGKAVMSHSIGTEGIKNAIRAGIWSVEHGQMLDEEAVDMFLKNGTYLVPTLSIVQELIERGDELGLTEVSRQKMNQLIGVSKESFQMAAEAGIRIAAGSDFIDDSSHGKNARELELMVQYGFTPMQAIVAATKTSAETCRVDHITGTLEKGKFADLLVLRSNPLDNISVLRDPEMFILVIKEGKSYLDQR